MWARAIELGFLKTAYGPHRRVADRRRWRPGYRLGKLEDSVYSAQEIRGMLYKYTHDGWPAQPCRYS
jgi:hypothetical protein